MGWSRGTRWAVLGIAALVLVADQASKSLAVKDAPGGGWAGGWVSVRLVRNTGASFGIGAGHPLLITLVAAAVLAVTAAVLSRARSRATALFLAAVLGGAAGNLADRLIRSPGLGRGAVVDWIHVAGYPAMFNIADVAIRLGAAGALLAALNAGHRAGWGARGPVAPRREAEHAGFTDEGGASTCAAGRGPAAGRCRGVPPGPDRRRMGRRGWGVRRDRAAGLAGGTGIVAG